MRSSHESPAMASASAPGQTVASSRSERQHDVNSSDATRRAAPSQEPTATLGTDLKQLWSNALDKLIICIICEVCGRIKQVAGTPPQRGKLALEGSPTSKLRSERAVPLAVLGPVELLALLAAVRDQPAAGAAPELLGRLLLEGVAADSAAGSTRVGLLEGMRLWSQFRLNPNPF
jgi:hypothetical protein